MPDRNRNRFSPTLNTARASSTDVHPLYNKPTPYFKTKPGQPIRNRHDKNESLFSFLIPEKRGGTGKQSKYFTELSNYYQGDNSHNYKYLSRSKYIPSNSKDKSATYIAITDNDFKKRIIEEWNNPENKFVDDNKKEKKLSYKKGLDALGKFNIHKGEDEKGEYISYYDKWDVGAIADKIGKPFEVYDRIYLNDQRESKKKNNSNNDMSNIRAYNTGGAVGTAIGSTATSFIPGIGPALAPIGGAVGGAIGGLFNKKPKIKDPSAIGYATLGYATGGNLPSAAIPMKNGAKKFVGPKHEQGGIPIDQNGNPSNNPVAEVEGDETMQGDFIFSDEIEVPEMGMTFAEVHEMLVQEDAPNEQIQELAQMQEQIKQSEGIPTGEPTQSDWQSKGAVMKSGGDLPKYRFGVGDPYAIRAEQQLTNNRPSVPDTYSQDPGSYVNKPKTISNGNTSPGKNRDWLGTAQMVAPSLIKAGAAMFAPKPKKTPKVPVRKIEADTSRFRSARKDLAGAFRSNPNQGMFARYSQGVNQNNAQENEYVNRVDMQNARSQSRTDQINTGIIDRNNTAQGQDMAKRIQLVNDAVTDPLTAATMNKRGREQSIANVLASTDRISDPTDRLNTMRVKLKAIGLSDAEIKEIISQYGKTN